MWNHHDLSAPEHNATFDHPELYSFVDLSQNSHQSGETHWDNLQAVRRRLIESGHVRPMNSVKIYGANTGYYGTSRDGLERFWRNIFGGLAASRFHRPSSGLGLSETAQAHIRSMRMLTGAMDVFACEPYRFAPQRASSRSRDEAYCIANRGVEYAVFFGDGGNVLLDVSEAAGKTFTLRWLDIARSQWLGETATVTPERSEDRIALRLVTPRDEGYWAVHVTARG
jgi:hypothetical protein